MSLIAKADHSAIALNSKFKAMFTTKARYTLLTGGRGSGKSFGGSTTITLLTYERTPEVAHKILYTRYTMKSAEMSIIPEFKEKIALLSVSNDFTVQKSDIQNRVSGSEILFRGIKTSEGIQTANLKSIQGVTTWVVDEAEEIPGTDGADQESPKSEIFDKIDLSIRTKGLQNRVVLMMNPTTRQHWIWNRWFKDSHRIEYIDGHPVPISTHPEVCHIHSTYLDNIQNLDKGFIDVITRMKHEDPDRYAYEIIGGWKLQLDGTLFLRSKLKRFRKADLTLNGIESRLAYVDVADEGTDSTSMPIGYCYKGKVLIPEVLHTDDDIDTAAPLCAEMCKRHKIDYVRVEANNQGGGFVRELRRLYPQHKVFGAKNSSSKHSRIVLSYGFVMNYMYFLAEEDIERGSDYDRFLTEMCNYLRLKNESKDHDDAPDALAGLASFVEVTLPHLFDHDPPVEDKPESSAPRIGYAPTVTTDDWGNEVDEEDGYG